MDEAPGRKKLTPLQRPLLNEPEGSPSGAGENAFGTNHEGFPKIISP
jgi:hypothetical protein